MRFILRKYVDADDARAALRKDRKTPVHDVYLKDGEEPRKGAEIKDAVGFHLDIPVGPYEDEATMRSKRNAP